MAKKLLRRGVSRVNNARGVPSLPPSTPPVKTKTSPKRPSLKHPSQQSGESKPIEKKDLLLEAFNIMQSESPLDKSDDLKRIVRAIIEINLNSHDVSRKYNFLIIYDTQAMLRTDADSIYQAISLFKERKPIALFIHSVGGQVEPAYLISKLCREHSQSRFISIVPRKAKSAATLICCGSDEIHMGSLTELGPIDPQIQEQPALGLKNAVQHLAELASQYPSASEMFAKYLSSSLDLISLGYYERIAESAAQYAERLLAPHSATLVKTPAEIAQVLVYGYKDHEFVIDRSEAESIFGPKTVFSNTPEYVLCNDIYNDLAVIDRFCSYKKVGFYHYGSCQSPCTFFKKKR